MARFDPKSFTPAANPADAAEQAPVVSHSEGPQSDDIERAAIIEHDGGIPGDWADGYARLLAMRCPANCQPARWHRFIDDCGLFLARWATRADQLGWKAHDLFAIAGGATFARVQLAGLLWLLDGREIVALTEGEAITRGTSGAILTYRRIDPQPGQRMAWEASK